MFGFDVFDIGGVRCWACMPTDAPDAQLPIVVMPAEAEMTAMRAQLLAPVEQAIDAGRGRPFILAGFESADWNRAFTPWPAPALFKKEPPFEGRADQTLSWLKDEFMPALQARYPASADRRDRCILGYSLGGLFALWALLNADVFGQSASCSGSLWYDGWLAYAEGCAIPEDSRVYLSLGRAEEKARNVRMAAVGDATRRTAAWLAADKNVRETALVWHDGGHFQDVEKRLADAIMWLMKPGD